MTNSLVIEPTSWAVALRIGWLAKRMMNGAK